MVWQKKLTTEGATRILNQIMLKAKGFFINLVLVTALTFVASQILHAQLHSLSKIHVSGNTAFTIPGDLNFANGERTPGMISTSKSGVKGFINFAAGSSWTGASDAQFIDGYVKVLHDNPFVFPIGSKGTYRPVSISGGAGTYAAFFDKSPTKLIVRKANKATGTAAALQVVEKGYWNVSGDQATTITLTWDATANVETLTEGAIQNLRVLGLKQGKWEVIPSSVDKYTLSDANHQLVGNTQTTDFGSGAISTTADIIPSDYEYFTLGAVKPAVTETTFSMYPNPSLSKLPLNIAYQLPEATNGTLQIYSATGSLLAERTLANEQGVVSLSNVTNVPGAYTVSIKDQNGKAVIKQLIVVAE